jgi:hypothetical protein
MKEYLQKRKEYIQSIIELELRKIKEFDETPMDSVFLYQCNLSEWKGRLTEVELTISMIEKLDQEKEIA